MPPYNDAFAAYDIWRRNFNEWSKRENFTTTFSSVFKYCSFICRVSIFFDWMFSMSSAADLFVCGKGWNRVCQSGILMHLHTAMESDDHSHPHSPSRTITFRMHSEANHTECEVRLMENYNCIPSCFTLTTLCTRFKTRMPQGRNHFTHTTNMQHSLETSREKMQYLNK